MEGSEKNISTITTTTTTPLSLSPSSNISPCAACKILRRRCVEKCILAPYFPPNDPLKFTIAHRVFGASNIIKSLQELPEPQRDDAVSSMVYEANARQRDPVYGCAGAICQLQRQVNELQEQLAKTQAEVLSLQCQNQNLMAIVCMEPASDDQNSFDDFTSSPHSYQSNTTGFWEENNLGLLWEPFWA